MNWLIFIITAYVVVALDVGLGRLWALPGPEGVSPNLVLIFLVWIGLMAPPRTVLWAAVLLGVVVDALQGPVHGVQILGPTALGFLAGGFVIQQIRGVMVRESIFTLAASTFFVGVFVYLVTIALYTFRGALWGMADTMPGWSVFDELVRAFQTLVYSALIAAPMGAILFRLSPLFAFPKPRNDRYY